MVRRSTVVILVRSRAGRRCWYGFVLKPGRTVSRSIGVTGGESRRGRVAIVHGLRTNHGRWGQRNWRFTFIFHVYAMRDWVA
jgi:hypothetical protein